ncbi:Zinc finger protein 813 [Channa argus]|uniref:Zinc finger protein 813 n=1 Tax=Channa argus TaxID=215402 RepID=A0A6G1QAA2_CHAAH|nr:Zinc finger protein 813 [Channa argus]
MVSRCLVPGCMATTVKKDSGIIYFRLPKDPERRKQWLKAANNPKYGENSPVESLRHLRVCSLHFKIEDYQRSLFAKTMCNTGRIKKLNKSATPSVHLNHGVPGPGAERPGLTTGMCSVVGCGSWRRRAERFKLPDDPEKRLEWFQFLFEVNGQRIKESSWTDINICSEHFTEDCFENRSLCETVLIPSAVPTLCVISEPDQPVEPVKTTEVACQCNFGASSNLTSCSDKSKHAFTDTITCGHDNEQDRHTNTDLNMEMVAVQQVEGKVVVNENCLLQLFCRKCPLCGSKLQMEKVTKGVLIVLNQQCLQCEYRNQWKSQINASIPAAEDQQLTGGRRVTSKAQKANPTDDSASSKIVSEILTFNDEESDLSDEGEDAGKSGMSSDGEWSPTEDNTLAEELRNDSDAETDCEGDEERDLQSPDCLRINELCTECGSFFNIQKPHTCEHKIKPFACNICGKRCVTEISLKSHSIIHNETYEHPCKYCHVTFKTRLDKLKHEQIHQDQKAPYKCPDCPLTFATNRKRRVHLGSHRNIKEFKCGVCGITFNDLHHLRRHSVVHTGLKPYKCSVCQRGFNQNTHLKSHMRLHTGERPYKCQHCDKCFNHNVSLKSHVQRYHSASFGRKRKVNKRPSDTGGAGNNGNDRGTHSGSDHVEEQDSEEEVQEHKKALTKFRRKCTGRPKGRPKGNAACNLDQAGKTKDKPSNTKTVKAKKLKKTSSSDEASESEQSDSDVSFASEKEEKEEKETKKRSTGRLRKASKK